MTTAFPVVPIEMPGRNDRTLNPERESNMSDTTAAESSATEATTEATQQTETGSTSTDSGADKWAELFKDQTPEDVARKLEHARTWEKRSKENASAAKRLAEIEDANKTEIQRATERLAAAERERDEARVEGLRLKVAVKHGISEEDAELFLTGTDEDSLTRQAERLAAKEAQRKADERADQEAALKSGNRVPKEGTPSQATDEGSERAFARQLFGGVT